LAVNIFVLKVESLFQQQVQTLLFALPANIEQDSLLIAILEMRISPTTDE